MIAVRDAEAKMKFFIEKKKSPNLGAYGKSPGKMRSFLLLPTMYAMVLFCGCAEKEANPDIRYLLDLATAESRCDELYQTFKENVRTPGVSIKKYRKKGASLKDCGASQYNPLVPSVTTFDSKIVVKVRGSEWSYEAVFFFSATNSLVAVDYMKWFQMPVPEIKPIDWHMKWSVNETGSVTNALWR